MNALARKDFGKDLHWSRRAQDPSTLAKSDEWRTPSWLFEYASQRYGPFLLDAAAAKWNHQVESYCDKKRSGLACTWPVRTWCNPPYSRGLKEKFLAHGREQILTANWPHAYPQLVCFLVPHDTSDGYWRRTVEAPAGKLLSVTKEFNDVGTVIQTRWSALTVEKTEIHGRLRYEHNDGSSSCRPGTARHSSALVVFARPGTLRPLGPQTSAFGPVANGSAK